MAELWASLLRLVGMGGAAGGYDKLVRRFENRLDRTEQRLDDCERDREELRAHITELTIRVEQCEDQREELRKRVQTLEEKAT